MLLWRGRLISLASFSHSVASLMNSRRTSSETALSADSNIVREWSLYRSTRVFKSSDPAGIRLFRGADWRDPSRLDIATISTTSIQKEFP